MIADILLIALFILSVINGYNKGFVKTLYRFAGLLVFLLFFIWLYSPVSAAFGGGVLGAAAVAVTALVLSYLTEGLVCKIAKFPLIKQANKLLGALLGLIYGVIMVVAFSVVLNSFAVFAPYTAGSQVIGFVLSNL